jgi:hypothetical protein
MSPHDGPVEGEDDPRGDADHTGAEGGAGASAGTGTGWVLRVPDDPRDLEEDRRAWLAEVVQRERERRRARRRALLGGPGGGLRGSGLGPLLALGLAAVVAVALLATALGGGTARPQPAPLATSTAPVGAVGGLLPDSDVRSALAGTRRDARALRPALLALVPAGCACVPLLREADLLASRSGVRLWLLAQEGAVQEVVQASTAATGGRAGVLEDVDGRIATAVEDTVPVLPAPTGATLLAVGADGLVDAVVTDAQDEPALDARLGPALRVPADGGAGG